jgi:hypothetical protein
MSEKKINPGINPNFLIERFCEEEKQILERLSKEWYLTSTGYEIKLGSSSYTSFLMKPVSIFSEMFNIEREVVCVFSPYPDFQPRTLDAFDKVYEQLNDVRSETVCRVLISKDSKIEERIDSLLKTDPENPIIIPFTYAELSSPYDPFFIRNRFRKHFYSRDLFDFLSPLKSDLYFFGRSQLVHELVNRHKSGEHTGLFGLRKSGKTSIIYAVERTLKASGSNYVSVDCESPSIHKLRWNELLEKIVLLYHGSIHSKVKINTEGRYEEKYAADSFQEDVLKIYQSKKRQNTLFLFDEVERITPSTASSLHWRDGEDFIWFWQTLRGFFQRNPEVFTYMLVGTNPSCVENAVLVGHENPIFASIPCQYVPNFTVDQVRQMVRKLGRFIGLQFEEIIYSKLADDFGGHPFLIRQACSVINRECKGDRPAKVDKALYEKVKKSFTDNSSHYLNMVVQVLKDWYPDEYEMLKYLAQGDIDAFNEFATDNSNFTKHLIGYGLVQQSKNGYAFNIEVVKEYLGNQHKYERINMSDLEKLDEISHRRNALEKSLRKIIKNILKTQFGRKLALNNVLAAVPESRRKSLQALDIDQLLSPDSSPLYLLDLINIIKRHWDIFKNVFEMEKNKVELMLDEINSTGRPEAHAKTIGKNEFDQLRLYFNKLEVVTNEWS